MVRLRSLDGHHERVRHRRLLLAAAATPLGAVVKPEQRLGCSGRRKKDLGVVWGCCVRLRKDLGFFKPYEAILPRLI